MNPVLTVVSIALAVLAGVGVYRFLRARSGKVVDALVNFRCPYCKRRLHFRQSQAGHRGMCPRCKHRIVFPTTPEAD
jgi:DNA-directed RNA polymerase subunit RPC12/RpoP